MALLFAFGYFPPEWPMSRTVNAALIFTSPPFYRRTRVRLRFSPKLRFYLPS